MSSFLARRPSAGLVVSVIALIVALGGTSYAAFTLPQNSVGTKQLKSAAVTGSKLKNGAVTKAKINVTGLTVPNAIHANTAGSATHATSADSASSVAYAHVLSDGTLDAAHSKNVTSVSNPSAGVYCLKTAVPVSNASATVDLGNSSGQFGIAIAVLSGQDPAHDIPDYCPAGGNALVGTAPPSGPPVANKAFWVTFN